MANSRFCFIFEFVICILLLFSTTLGMAMIFYIDKDNKFAFIFELISAISSCFIGLAAAAVGFSIYGLFKQKIRYCNITLYQKDSEYSQIPPKDYPRLYPISFLFGKGAAAGFEPNKDEHKCFFKSKYYDLETSKLLDFQCKEDISKNGFCNFHQVGFSSNQNELDYTLDEKINKLIENRKEVFCIGYHISIISLRGKEIYRPLYFHDAKIDIADFRDSNFATKEATAYFINTSFKEVSFDNAEIHGKAIFINSNFEQIFKPIGYFQAYPDCDFAGKYSGYASFRNTKFYRGAIFYKSKFSGIVNFDNTIFFDIADFRKCKFLLEKTNTIWKNVYFYQEFLHNRIKIRDNFLPSG